MHILCINKLGEYCQKFLSICTIRDDRVKFSAPFIFFISFYSVQLVLKQNRLSTKYELYFYYSKKHFYNESCFLAWAVVSEDRENPPWLGFESYFEILEIFIANDRSRQSHYDIFIVFLQFISRQEYELAPFTMIFLFENFDLLFSSFITIIYTYFYFIEK